MFRQRASKTDPNTERIVDWLADHSAELEQNGLAEGGIAAEAGLAAEQATAAIDHLEDREIVVRMPHPLANPPGVLLKAGRAWPEAREAALAKRAGTRPSSG